jgi:hypothetical protein
MIPIPKGEKELVAFANELIETCTISQGMRAAYYRLLNTIAETGNYDGTKSLINMMNTHLERTQSHLFSPVELKFALDYDNEYSPDTIKKGATIAKHLTRHWEKASLDMLFGQGVYEGLKYGCSLLKQWPKSEGSEEKPRISYEKRLVMPWNFGVWREDENDIDNQEVLCETSTLTMPEVWQRIWNFPNANKLYQQIGTHAAKGGAGEGPDSFFHQVLSTSQLQTGVQQSTRPLPGGIVQLGNDPNYAIMGPTIGAPVVKMHELWIKGEEDYVTLQMIHPDILLSRFKLSNLLGVPHSQPYRKIQPNPMTNFFWGRSELIDLIEPQGLLSQWAGDIKRLFGLQIDKIIAFSGENSVTDEIYAQFRAAGYINMGQGGKAEDLTPKMPPDAIQMLKFIIEMINMLGSFPEILQGKGESGVRAGVHADTLLKTASPTLRDRSLLVERQCAVCADLTLTMMEAKEDRKYWIDPKKMEDNFMITDLPEDWRVTVDSHSGSPIFSEDSKQLIFALRKTGDVDGEFAIDNLPIPNKEAAKASLKERQQRNTEMQKQLLGVLSPEGKDKAIEKMLSPHGKH